MAIVNGFAGLSVKENGVSIAPFVPDAWEGYCFKFRYKGSLVRVCVHRREIEVTLLEGERISLGIYGKKYVIEGEDTLVTKVE